MSNDGRTINNIPLSQLSEHDRRIQSKLRAGAEAEEILEMGQDNKIKAAKAVKEVENKRQAEENKKQTEALTKLNDSRRGNFYRERVRFEAKRRIGEHDIPAGFMLDCVLTSRGLAFGYKHKNDKLWYMKGMTISTIPMYDLQGIDRLIWQAIDAMKKREGDKLEQTASGVILPK